jgi:probable HAF family extracellular repeat protein
MSRFLAVWSVLLLGTTALGGAMFQGLGDLPGGANPPRSDGFESFAYAVSADGSTVVGASWSALGTEAFRWTRSTGMVGLGQLAGQPQSWAYGISADNSTIVGGGLTDAFRWNASEGMVSIGHMPGGTGGCFANAVSADGSVIVGTGTTNGYDGQRAFRWTAATGLADLGDLPGVSGFDTHASGVSGDASVITGFARIANGYDDQAFRWTAADGMVGLGPLPGGYSTSQATAISLDGRTIVGHLGYSNPGQAFRWTAAEGVVALGTPLAYGSATAVSADGSVIVGMSGIDPFVWESSTGMRSIRDVLVTDYGLNLTGWTLDAATGVSADGLTIVGSGINPAGDPEAWIARLPEPGSALLLLTGAIFLMRRGQYRLPG